ncbi:MAG: glycosyltransferase family 2 protein [Chloroflexi bacterium]|nr:glycosyltransferase [Chloroflexota bacterium]MBV6437594.1 Undecaprenyl-phosphate 4-deoxy-4-formamido-L-arabinose transferase [Anaerolineae bacterium]MBW7880962.1 glycosyltransferase family 2 protein [Anaerolineae bacterium]NOG52100.1 glycosyltransferase family 2 protein [Chloroflexota bacterium]RIK18260.1 MAG: glycosyltransferase [Chloroflexota bacterium]
MQRSISVVIPVYNGALSIGEVVRQLHEALPSLAERFEIVLVEDDGRDNSWDVIQQLATQYPATVRGFKMARNFGQHNALLCGLRAATGDIIITMDDDLQHPVDQIPLLLAELDKGFDVVYGTPQREEHNRLRALASQITKLALQSTMGAETARNISAFRALRRHIVAASNDYHGPTVVLDSLLTWGTRRFSAVKVRHDPRTLGASNYTFRKLLNYAANMVTSFSIVPLRIASVLGFGMTLFGVGVLIYVLVRYLFEGSPPGFPFLASIIALFGGAQLLALGIIGEYLARMHLRTMGRPSYVIRETTAPPEGESPK